MNLSFILVSSVLLLSLAMLADPGHSHGHLHAAFAGVEVVNRGVFKGSRTHESSRHMHFLKHVDHPLLGIVFYAFLISFVFRHPGGLSKLGFQFLVGQVVFGHDA